MASEDTMAKALIKISDEMEHANDLKEYEILLKSTPEPTSIRGMRLRQLRMKLWREM